MQRLLPALLLALAAGYAAADPAADRGGVAGGIFTGELPCADCDGVHYRLHLRSDRAFVLETTRLGGPTGPASPAAVLGVWTESADGRTVELRQAGELPLFFAIRNDETLRKLDSQGRAIRSQANHDLVRTHAVEKFQPLLRLQGTYGHIGGAGQFHECTSRVRFPVAESGERAALERGYEAAGAKAGADVLVSVEARIAVQPSAAGDRLEDALVIERFLGAWPGETCGEPFAPAELTGTYWKLTRLGDRPVPARDLRSEPSLMLKAQGSQMGGFGGCNRFMGAFRQEGATLDLGRVAATMMACRDGMDEEGAYFQALQATVRYRIFGSHLELYDRKGNMVARFEARRDQEKTP